MSIKDQLTEDMKQAMKDREQVSCVYRLFVWCVLILKMSKSMRRRN